MSLCLRHVCYVSDSWSGDSQASKPMLPGWYSMDVSVQGFASYFLAFPNVTKSRPCLLCMFLGGCGPSGVGCPSPLFLLFPVPSSPPSPPAQVEVLSHRVKQCPPVALPEISSHSWNWDYPIPIDFTKLLAAARNRTRVFSPLDPDCWNRTSTILISLLNPPS